MTFFTRHGDVAAMLRDRRFGRDIRHIVPVNELDHHTYPTEYPTWYRYIRGSFIDLEPPEHTRIRRLVSGAFTKRAAETMRPRVREVARQTLQEALPGPIDVIEALATPIPLITICDLLGVAQQEGPQCVAWSHAIVRLFEPDCSEAEAQAAERATIEFVDYIGHHADQRRTAPRDDLLSDLVHAETEGARLSRDDIIATAILVLNAGHEATVHAIGNAVLALAEHPLQYRRMRREPDILPTACEELLRYDSPLQMFERWVLEDLEWGGRPFRQGDKVGLLFGAANRDPAVFDQPHSLDLTRNPNPHVSFGAGIHHCVGAPLARVELQETLAALVEHVPELHLDVTGLERIESVVFRGVRGIRLSVE